jgi:Tfp pilus assembly protein PilF
VRALAEIDAAISIDPQSVPAFLSRGMLLDQAGKTEEAAACFDRAVGLAPGAFDSYAQRARFHMVHGERSAALEDLRTAFDLAPRGSPARQTLERLLNQLQRSAQLPK